MFGTRVKFPSRQMVNYPWLDLVSRNIVPPIPVYRPVYSRSKFRDRNGNTVTGRALDAAEIKARLNGLTRVIIGGTRSVRKYFECFAVRRVEIERFLRGGVGINRSKNANWFRRAAEWKEKKTEREKSLSFIDRLFIDTFYSTDKSIDWKSLTRNTVRI